MRSFHVYILASRSRVLYTGVTGDLARRIHLHRHSLRQDCFTAKYRVHRLVYFETFADPNSAITREKQIKGWPRARKIALIESMNPRWKDLGRAMGIV